MGEFVTRRPARSRALAAWEARLRPRACSTTMVTSLQYILVLQRPKMVDSSSLRHAANPRSGRRAAVKEADFQYLHQATALTKGNLSVHLSKLEEAGYIAIEKTFRGKYQLTICRMTERGREMLDNYRKIIKGAP